MSDEFRANILRSQAREALAAARARCCSHGVTPEHCHEKHPQADEPEEAEA